MRFSLASCAAAIALSFAPAAQAAPEVFDSPDAAVAAVVAAIEAEDAAALVAVFGPEYEDLVLTGDAERDRAVWSEFLRDYRSLHRLESEADGRVTLYTGRDQTPFPAAIVETGAGWAFDGAGAREEIALRRLGENELDVIDLLRGYVRAQMRYRAIDYDGDGVPQFASHILSDSGTRDGLYWPDDTGAPESPIGAFMARASAEGYAVDGLDVDPEPYLGYYYHILQRQGPSAPGGEFSYMVGDRMLAGHAMIAYPAAYGDTGIMSFLVSEAGVVYEADLGEDTLAVAGAIDSFDPDENWTAVAD